MSVIENFKHERCISCRGLIISGPVHYSTVKITDRDGKRVVTEVRCQHCAERYAEACWPEDWGPCPHTPRTIGQSQH